MLQVPDNQNIENTDHSSQVLEPHLQDFKPTVNASGAQNHSTERKTSSYESCRGLLNNSDEQGSPIECGGQ